MDRHDTVKKSMTGRVYRGAAPLGFLCALLSACSGQPPDGGGPAIAVQAVAAPVLSAMHRDSAAITSSAREGRVDIAAHGAPASADATRTETTERELGTASDGGYHAYPK
jgi:hypothetical protein